MVRRPREYVVVTKKVITAYSVTEELQTWFWHNGYYEQGWECDFERMRLGATFTGLGLNAKPMFDDEDDPAGGDNECFSINHYDENDVEDPDAEFLQMKPVKDQKYKVGEKEYLVRR
jgi:hypothetical protein